MHEKLFSISKDKHENVTTIKWNPQTTFVGKLFEWITNIKLKETLKNNHFLFTEVKNRFIISTI